MADVFAETMGDLDFSWAGTNYGSGEDDFEDRESEMQLEEVKTLEDLDRFILQGYGSPLELLLIGIASKGICIPHEVHLYLELPENIDLKQDFYDLLNKMVEDF